MSEAERLFKQTEIERKKLGYGEQMYRKGVEDAMKSIPAADVQPVRRGKWIDHQEGRWVYAKCSECETVHDVRSNFCPSCGAMMLPEPPEEGET